ncbi:hypothetical protein M441DRAFT_371930 [Trichoderma asperellum CBS 433.97]|uniref:Uncharacterized protein n=1 Tax=Trichoderma asperellum (strain ATCC 204424 / CBS 433.97 / NBRC 101777) TaxID=1042311 RepID=A0A2T3ZF12_TRIA4|nr:hypothetical protein M441DRAFT_371930 [Trichoderma asperellum CBS 433.97]PTB43395.1 hypothetical protein M441DRAFT_371930 [Trichoderma asperellum CBS 433.97]
MRVGAPPDKARSSPAGLASRRSLVGNGDSAQRDASERQGDALRQWIGGSRMRDVDAGAGHEMVFGLAIGTTASCGWRAGAHVPLLRPYTSCYLRLIRAS